MNAEQTFQDQITEFVKYTGHSVVASSTSIRNEFVLQIAQFQDFQVMMLHNPDSKNPTNQVWLVWEFESKLNGMGQSLKHAYYDLMDQDLKHTLAAMYDRLY